MIMVALSEKYRLPYVRSHFGSGAPAEGYCDLCQTDLRPGRTDIRVAARDRTRPDGGATCRLAGRLADALEAAAR